MKLSFDWLFMWLPTFWTSCSRTAWCSRAPHFGWATRNSSWTLCKWYLPFCPICKIWNDSGYTYLMQWSSPCVTRARSLLLSCIHSQNAQPRHSSGAWLQSHSRCLRTSVQAFSLLLASFASAFCFLPEFFLVSALSKLLKQRNKVVKH